MRKYLIQDITPPGKKHVTHPHKIKVTHEEDEKAIKKSHSPHPLHHATHKTIHHTSRVGAKEDTSEHIEDHVVEKVYAEQGLPPTMSPVILSEVEPTANLVTEKTNELISPTLSPDTTTDSVDSAPMNKIEGELVSPLARSMFVDKVIPRTPSYFDDAMEAGLPAGAWQYSSNNRKQEIQNTASPESYSIIGQKNFITWKTWIPWIIGLAVIITIGAVVLNYYSGVEVLIIQKRDSVIMDEKVTVFKTPKDKELSYAIIIATTSVSREVTAMQERVVTAKASGNIVVYNTQNIPQRLIKNTRFQSSKGKIYRINNSIDVPKATTQGGKIIPGSVSSVIFADEAGPDYNSEPTDFSVPGLKSSKIFDMVYARSQGAIIGGASGAMKNVSDEDLKQASDELRIQLETKLRSDVRSLVAPWSTKISYDSGMIVEIGKPTLSSTQSSASDKAVVSLSGAIYLITFERQELTNAVVKSLIPTFKGEAVHITNLDTLTVGIPKMTGEELLTSEKLSVALKGTPALEWSVDQDEVKKALIGIFKKDFNSKMSQFTTVERAKATIRPVWQTTFPIDPSKIKIQIVETIPE